MAKNNDKTATEETQKEHTSTKTAAPASKEGIVTYNQDEPKMIKVHAAEGTQLYDPVSQTLYTDDKKGVEAREGDQFVQTNLTRGKLKKVS